MRQGTVPVAVAVAVAVTTVAGSAFAFFHDYPRLMEIVSAGDDVATPALLRYVFPLLCDLGMASAALWVAAAYGLARQRPWTPGVVAAAAVFGLIAVFMPIPPTAGRGHIFPSTLVMALPAFVIASFVTARWSLRLPWKVVLLGTAGAFAALLCFINGTASTHRVLAGHDLVYVFSQRIHWLLILAWLIYVIGLFSRRPWAVPVGIGVAAAATLAGVPVAVADTLHLGRFSAFAASPIWAALMLTALVATRKGEEGGGVP